jgi:hypothetical protein
VVLPTESVVLISTSCLKISRAPVQDYRDRRGHDFLDHLVDEKPLAVWRDCVLLARDPDGGRLIRQGRQKERDRSAEVDVLAAHIERNRHRHQPVVEPEVEELLAIATPAHLAAAISCHALRDRPIGKRLHVNLVAAGCVRLIRDPLAVRRELPVALVEFGAGDGNRNLVPLHRERQEIVPRFGLLLAVEQESSVGRPVHWQLRQC